MRRPTRTVVLALIVCLAGLPVGAGAAPTAPVYSAPTAPALAGPAGTGSGPTAPSDGALADRGARTNCSFPVSATDATGTEVTLSAEPGRIVVLQASTAQAMWELGVQDRVVGMPVRSYTAYLNGSTERTGVLNEDGSVNRERVVALDPDLVLAPEIVPNATVESLRNAGVTVYKSGYPSSLDSITERVSLYGRLVGACERARSVNEAFDERVERIRENASERYQPRVFYYFFNFTAGRGTFTNEVVEAAGGRNVAAEAGVSGYQQANLELVAERNPEVVVVTDDSPVPSGEPWNSTAAYRNDRVVRVNTNLIQQPGPRVVEPMGNLSAAFAAVENSTTTATPTPEGRTGAATVEPTDTPTATSGATPDGTAPAGTTPGGEGTGSDGRGFGLGAALVALAGAVLFASRRG